MAESKSLKRYLLKKVLYRIDFQLITEKMQEEMFAFIADFNGDVPGAAAKDCGNYLMMNLPMAKWEAAKFLHEVLEQLTEENLNYPASL